MKNTTQQRQQPEPETETSYYSGNPCEHELHLTVTNPPEVESIRILQALTILTDDRLVYMYEQPEDRNPKHDAELGLVMAYEFPYQTSWKRVFQRLGWEDTEPNRRRLWAAVVAGNQCVIQVRNPAIPADPGYTQNLVEEFLSSVCNNRMFEIKFSMRINLFEFLFQNPEPVWRDGHREGVSKALATRVSPSTHSIP